MTVIPGINGVVLGVSSGTIDGQILLDLQDPALPYFSGDFLEKTD